VKRRKKTPAVSSAPPGAVRLQKVLAEAGIASRRAAEEMIREGRVAVNGEVISSLPCFVMPNDEIAVDGGKIGKRLQHHKQVYFLLNKPRSVVCTSRDPQGRRRAIDFLPDLPQRVYCVGRLDAESTGLILLTNDGALTQHLTHPSGEVAKTYVVTVAGCVRAEDLDRLKRGVHLDGKRTVGAGVKVLRRGPKQTLLEITLREGRNREIRRMLVRLGHKVRRLRRVAIGPISDRGLGVGCVRELSAGEIRRLRQAGSAGKSPTLQS